MGDEVRKAAIFLDQEFKVGNSISLKAVYWNDTKSCFQIQDTKGILDSNGNIQFEKRTMDCFSVPSYKIGKMYSNEENGNDYDVVFCLPTDEEVAKAKIIWAEFINNKICETEYMLDELRKTYDELRKTYNAILEALQ